MDCQGSLLHLGSERFPLWSHPTEKLLLLKLLRKLMLVLIERCQITQSITVCCLWGCITTDQSECLCWPLLTPGSTNMDSWAPELVQWKKMAWSDESCFPLHYVNGASVCASLTLGTHGTHGTMGTRLVEAAWCSGQGSAVKPWAQPSMWMLLWHIPTT